MLADGEAGCRIDGLVPVAGGAHLLGCGQCRGEGRCWRHQRQLQAVRMVRAGAATLPDGHREGGMLRPAAARWGYGGRPGPPGGRPCGLLAGFVAGGGGSWSGVKDLRFRLEARHEQ